MPVVLANDLLALHLPQPRIMVGASSNQVSRVGREGAVPHPALVTRERLLQGVGLGLGLGGVGVVVGGLDVAHLPDLGRVVGAARRQLLDVGREQDARDVLLVRREVYVMDAWEPMVFEARRRGVNAAYARPKEGYLLWAMAAYIVNNPRRPREREQGIYELLNFMLGPCNPQQWLSAAYCT